MLSPLSAYIIETGMIISYISVYCSNSYTFKCVYIYLRFQILALVQDKGRTFGIYAIAVTRASDNEVWHIYRRYSDFYDLHASIKDKVKTIAITLAAQMSPIHNVNIELSLRKCVDKSAS